MKSSFSFQSSPPSCRHEFPIDLTGRRVFTSDLAQGGLIIETSRGVELKIKWDDEDEPVWWDIDEFEGDQALFLQISMDTLVRLDRSSVFRFPELASIHRTNAADIEAEQYDTLDSADP